MTTNRVKEANVLLSSSAVGEKSESEHDDADGDHQDGERENFIRSERE